MRNPLAQAVQFTPLHPKFTNVTIIRWGSFSLSFIVPTLVVALYVSRSATYGWIWWVAVAVTVAVGVWLIWLAVRRARVYGYAERDDELLIRSGIMFHRVTVVPYGRMQQVNVETGPLLKRYGLASVELVTASAGTDAKIPGVALEEAERLREKLTALGEANMEGL